MNPNARPCCCANCDAELTGADRSNADTTGWLCSGCYRECCAELDAQLAANVAAAVAHQAASASVAA